MVEFIGKNARLLTAAGVVGVGVLASQSGVVAATLTLEDVNLGTERYVEDYYNFRSRYNIVELPDVTNDINSVLQVSDNEINAYFAMIEQKIEAETGTDLVLETFQMTNINNAISSAIGVSFDGGVVPKLDLWNSTRVATLTEIAEAELKLDNNFLAIEQALDSIGLNNYDPIVGSLPITSAFANFYHTAFPFNVTNGSDNFVNTMDFAKFALVENANQAHEALEALIDDDQEVKSVPESNTPVAILSLLGLGFLAKMKKTQNSN